MRNICLLMAYDGTDFHGWQRQPEKPTVQGCLEAAIEKIVGEKVTVWGSGRTDAGVHAANQLANFKSDCPIPCANLVRALNNLLPPAVRVKDAREVADFFHARYDARSKTYRYRILLAPIASPFIARFVYHYPHDLDRKSMAAAARLFEGEHDFTSFAGSARAVHKGQVGVIHESALQEDEPASVVRTIFSSRILWRLRTSILIYEVKGSGFLHHMVRNIVGTLLEVGRGNLEPGQVVRILEARDRVRAGPAAPAQGLCLMNVEY